jgi:hypothetical protein
MKLYKRSRLINLAEVTGYPEAIYFPSVPPFNGLPGYLKGWW